jgi:hypothetical protein
VRQAWAPLLLRPTFHVCRTSLADTTLHLGARRPPRRIHARVRKYKARCSTCCPPISSAASSIRDELTKSMNRRGHCAWSMRAWGLAQLWQLSQLLYNRHGAGRAGGAHA